MNELIGEFTHKLDSKFRISLPSKIRSIIGESVIVTRGLDGCAYIYPQSAWETITENLRALSLGQSNARSLSRYILSSASEVTIDKAGRVLLPENLRQSAKLESDVIIAGVGNRLELWNPAVWETQQANLLENIDQVAENLGEIGMI